MAGRPKADNPKLPLTGRLAADKRAKFLAIAARENRTQTDMVRVALEAFVSGYEATHGPIVLPTSPST